MTQPYMPQTWTDDSPATPVSAARLGYMETGIAAVAARHAVHVGPTNQLPAGLPGLWVETDAGDGNDLTFWIEDGAP